MKMLITLCVALFANCIYADSPSVDLKNYFTGYKACFILYNLNQNKIVTKYNPSRCQERLPPQSTFKIPLSLMAFDQNIINQDTVFKWNGVTSNSPLWDRDQTPKTWLSNSVVWVSQQLTPQLGLQKISAYLQKFHYGNEDFTGDSGQNNGLKKAWLNSSLKISANEQLLFLTALVRNELPVSKTALQATRENIDLTTTPEGWELYGKTGSNFKPGLGWFIGFLSKGGQTYIFVTNISGSEATGPKAKKITQEILDEFRL